MGINLSIPSDQAVLAQYPIRSSNSSTNGLFLLSRRYLFHLDIPILRRLLFRSMLYQSALYNPESRMTHLSDLCVYLGIHRTEETRERKKDKDSSDCSSDNPANLFPFRSPLPFNSFPSAILLLVMEVDDYFLDFTAILTRVGVAPVTRYQQSKGKITDKAYSLLKWSGPIHPQQR